MPPGSYLVIGHGASDIQADAAPEVTRRYNERSSARLTLRTREQVARFFDGLELVGPGWSRSASGGLRTRSTPAPPAA